mmetsp:Transcript_59391/g.66465  ORF Transcript_59391/g.66465 Transcript_59391/m.66465 type:complete len:224 (-) Transcript_59391:56-727(-)|eukprot:CAMPEP_0170976616 /NCGR_PEP_ID=MMETSP0736-20130129/60_1 /TAXON_ID=186038 /ORGANISM="Fragilariopsis kerguelensis, Strain L26-C5" /LENGTH=223 /DNA_ID=CAMNT_0011398529 /DNA_START=66 /DNA_END=737 /DNA_ORIENTATION=+
MNTLTTTLLLSCLVVANGFFQKAAVKKTSSPISPITQEAVDIWGAKFSYDPAPPREKNFLNDIARLGVPKNDPFDGTPIYTKKSPDEVGFRFTDLTETEIINNFSALAAVYGEERSIEMVKIFPLSLSFDSKIFSETFSVWSEIYGEEKAMDMVSRNPNLLAVGPKDAPNSTDQTMAFSYIVAVTRPIGLFGPIGIIALISVPGIEAATGIPIKEPFLQLLGL